MALPLVAPVIPPSSTTMSPPFITGRPALVHNPQRSMPPLEVPVSVQMLNEFSIRRFEQPAPTLPEPSTIRAIHIYDFDNTLFLSAFPSPAIWNKDTVRLLQRPESWEKKGWWRDPRIMNMTGDGCEVEKARGWEGWWNEDVVKLAKMSILDEGVLTVMLTGRTELGYDEIIGDMLRSKGLGDMDLIVLKGEGWEDATADFKMTFLTHCIRAYHHLDEVRIYEDRPKHVELFERFFAEFKYYAANGSVRAQIDAKVVAVAPGNRNLDPVKEVSIVRQIIDSQNKSHTVSSPFPRLRMSKSVTYVGYMLSQESMTLALSLLSSAGGVTPFPGGTDPSKREGYNILANAIIIAFHAVPHGKIQSRTGGAGLGQKVDWIITHLGCLSDRLWAARVAPLYARDPIYQERAGPQVLVLATKRGTKPVDVTLLREDDWKPFNTRTDNKAILNTVLAERAVLSIEHEDAPASGKRNNYANNTPQRKRSYNDVAANGNGSFSENDRGGYKRTESGDSYGRSNSFNNSYNNENQSHDNSNVNNYRGGRGGGRGRGDYAPRGEYTPRGSSNGEGRGRGGGGEYRVKHQYEKREYYGGGENDGEGYSGGYAEGGRGNYRGGHSDRGEGRGGGYRGNSERGEGRGGYRGNSDRGDRGGFRGRGRGRGRGGNSERGDRGGFRGRGRGGQGGGEQSYGQQQQQQYQQY